MAFNLASIKSHPRYPYWSKMLAIGVLYYAEGLPYGFLFKTVPYYLSKQGFSFTAIGLAGLLHLPWTLKFIWAPLVDRFGRRSAWIIACQLALITAIAITPWLDVSSFVFVITLGMVAIAGATQDIAIDAYAIDILEPEEQGPANGIRVTTYRVALIAGGGLTILISDYIGWIGAFAVAAATLLAVSLVVLFWPVAHRPRLKEQSTSQKSVWQATKLAWLGILKLPNLWAVIPFILFFKAGDVALGQMIPAFWDKSGFTSTQYGMISGIVGTVLTIGGSLMGGALVTRWGLWRSLWILGGLQAVSTLVYSWAALYMGTAWITYMASVAESVCIGLATAPFLTFLMRMCNKQASAGQYAILSAIFGLSGTLAASLSGLTVTSVGFFWFFNICFLVALPAFAFLPFLPIDRAPGVRADKG